MASSVAKKEEHLTSEEAFISAATVLFSEKWYGTVSVAEICRKAHRSNGLFYRYFKDKEVIFRRILESVISRIASSIGQVRGDSAEQRLESFNKIIFDFSQEHPSIVKVFREGQYRFLEYEEQLRTVYESGFQKVLMQPPSLPSYLFALGGLRFAATRAAFQGIPIDLGTLNSILGRGLFTDLDFDPDKVFSSSITQMPLEMLPNGRERMLREGKLLIGRKGYYKTNIFEITSAAGLSTGAFYIYFESKEAFFQELIHRVGSDLRRFISLNLVDDLNPLERELRGLWLFIVFLSLDKHCYNLVREAEFVLPTAAREYYAAFVHGYKNRLSTPKELDETTVIEFLLGTAHYLGIEVVFEHSPENARNVIAEIGEYYKSGLLSPRSEGLG